MPPSDPRPSFNPSTQELVLLVHGTFANNPSKSRDDHLRWWQAGGDVWNRIDEQLPEKFHVASDTKTEVFSWSGNNSERDRRAGGRDLFKHLQKLEKDGTRYHLIGHSHGESVIWHCLLESVKRRLHRRDPSDSNLSLPGLQSYTTVGTPFFQLRSFGIISRLNPWFWLLVVLITTSMLVGLAMLKLDEIHYLKKDPYFQNFKSAFESIKTEITQSTSSILDHTLIAAFCEFVQKLLAHEVAAAGICLLMAGTGFVAMMMWAWASAVQLEAAVVREGTRVRNQAFVEFGSRWLGIWSRHDEAINGLRASLKLGGHIAPRIEVSGANVFDYDRRMRAYRFFCEVVHCACFQPACFLAW